MRNLCIFHPLAGAPATHMLDRNSNTKRFHIATPLTVSTRRVRSALGLTLKSGDRSYKWVTPSSQ